MFGVRTSDRTGSEFKKTQGKLREAVSRARGGGRGFTDDPYNPVLAVLSSRLSDTANYYAAMPIQLKSCLMATALWTDITKFG